MHGKVAVDMAGEAFREFISSAVLAVGEAKRTRQAHSTAHDPRKGGKNPQVVLTLLVLCGERRLLIDHGVP